MNPATSKPSFLVVCLNPTIQRTLVFGSLEVGQVNRAQYQRVDSSGKGVNAARVLVQLGAQALQLTQVGGLGQELFSRLAREDGIDLLGIPGATDIRTCTTIIDQTNESVTELVEEGALVDRELERAIRNEFFQRVSQVDGVVITGSKAPGFGSSLYPDLVILAKAAGKKVFLDYRGPELLDSLTSKPDWVKINLSEFASTFGLALPENTEPEDIPPQVFDRLSEVAKETGGVWVLTNGAKPTCYFSNNELFWKTCPAAQVINSIGSGDSVLAGIAYGAVLGFSVEASIDLGLECGVKNLGVLKPGSLY